MKYLTLLIAVSTLAFSACHKKQPASALSTPPPKTKAVPSIPVQPFHLPQWDKETLVVIDAGHGGVDTGALYYEPLKGATPKGKQKPLVAEAPHTYDVACRLAAILNKAGVEVVFTVANTRLGFRPQNTNEYLAPTPDTVFTSNGQVVRAMKVGMEMRLAAVTEAVEKYHAKNVFFVSIHFDSTSPDVSGPDLIFSKGSDAFAENISNEFAKASLFHQKAGSPIYSTVENADARHGMRNLFVLCKKNNPIDQCVLAELANIANYPDRVRIKDWKTRQRYAECIAKGITNTISAKPPPSLPVRR